MEHPEERYYKLNRFLLSVSGLWPYQSKWSACLMRTFITVVMLSSIFLQLASIFVFDITMDFIIQMIQCLVSTVGTLGHLYARIGYIDKFKELFEHMWNDWTLQKTNSEVKMMHEHAETTRLFTLYYSLVIYVNLVGYNIWLFVPQILDVISPMNESRPRIPQPFNIEYFIDKERYFYLIRSHICLVLFLSPVIFLTSCTLFLVLTQHACGMCELLGYRVERLFCVIEGAAGCGLIRETKIRNMAAFIRLHYNVIQFIDVIETCHAIPFLLDLVGVLAMGVTLTQILTSNSSIEILFRNILFCIITLCYLFTSNYMGQRITDASSSVCDKVYNSAWYEAIVLEQKSLLLIMRRRFYPVTVTACRFYVMSLQSFGMIFQTAISYCMFMRRL